MKQWVEVLQRQQLLQLASLPLPAAPLYSSNWTLNPWWLPWETEARTGSRFRKGGTSASKQYKRCRLWSEPTAATLITIHFRNWTASSTPSSAAYWSSTWWLFSGNSFARTNAFWLSKFARSLFLILFCSYFNSLNQSNFSRVFQTKNEINELL